MHSNMVEYQVKLKTIALCEIIYNPTPLIYLKLD